MVTIFLAGVASAWYGGHAFAMATPPDTAATQRMVGGNGSTEMSMIGMDMATNLTTIGCPATQPPDAATPNLISLPATTITNDSGFTPAAGVQGGSGTPTDPYRFVGVRMQSLTLADTTANFVIAGSDIQSLTLDWTGRGGLVCENHIGDLRVNNNDAHTGPHTAGRIEHNDFDTVSQIRHYNGDFLWNVVGDKLAADVPASTLSASGQTPDTVVLNIAGMNAADFAYNTIYGGVDMKLHGHHFNSSPGDWVDRYQLYEFHDNTIIDPDGFGLRYNDLNHAGDDRTAASDPEPQLNLPHREFTTVVIENNTIVGAPLRVEIFNAPDPLILPGEHGSVTLRNNTIRDVPTGSGIIVNAVRAARLLIEGNTVSHESVQGIALPTGTSAGIDMVQFANSTIVVAHNTIANFDYGIRGLRFDRLTHWTDVGNSISGAQTDVWYDSSVQNPPGH
ncbi:MAG: hypothetical protein ACYDDF_05650 [Thermoplasmatota archaeon]